MTNGSAGFPQDLLNGLFVQQRTPGNATGLHTRQEVDAPFIQTSTTAAIRAARGQGEQEPETDSELEQSRLEGQRGVSGERLKLHPRTGATLGPQAGTQRQRQAFVQ